MSTKILPLIALLTLAVPNASCVTTPDGGGPVVTNPNPANENVNGSRIQLRYAVTDFADGSHFVSPVPTYYDTKLGTTCSVRVASDGKPRCVPISDNWVYRSKTLFQDASCVNPVGYMTTGGCAPRTDQRFVSDSTPLACDIGFKFSMVNAAIARTDIYINDKGMCRKTMSTDFNAFNERDTYFTIGAQLEAEDFVALKQ